MSTDENLLFGVLALQADLIDAPRFAEACSAWAMRKESALADLLVERGWLSAENRAVVEKLVRWKLDKHHGDARASLAEATTGKVRHALADVADEDLRRSLAESSAVPSDPWRTTPHEVQARGRYSLAYLHAQGGMGQVWLARDEQLGRVVALKELLPERQGHPQARGRFLEEARITGQLEHPGIVPVHELVRGEDGSAFYTMRLVRGRTLGDAIREYHKDRSRLVLRRLLANLVATCNTIAYAHSRGVLHRDLKPANVVLGDYGEVVVLDWGLAKVIGQQNNDETGLLPVSLEPASRDETLQGQVLGTPAYVAPEQAEGRTDLLGPATDVYGLGAILYQTLTGKPPFEGEDTPSVLRQVVREQPQRPSLLVPGTPRALEAVCLKALAKAPANRYPSAAELAREIERWLADEPVAAWREPWRLRAGRWVRRHQSLVASLVVGLLLLVVFGSAGGAWWVGERQRQQAAMELTLERIDALLGQSRLEEARGILDHAQARAVGVGSLGLRERLRQAQANLELVEELDRIRLSGEPGARAQGHAVDPMDVQYAEAFARINAVPERDDPAEVARRLARSPIRDSLLSALDVWAVAADHQRRPWILSIARALDPDPVRDQFRQPAFWSNRTEQVRLVAQVDGASLTPSLAQVASMVAEGRPEKLRLLRQAQAAYPSDFWLTYRLANVLWKQNDLAGAEAHARVAVAVRPRGAAYGMLGWVLALQGKHAEAESAYRKALESDPKYVRAHTDLGLLLMQQKKYSDAEASFRKGIELEPAYVYAHAGLGEALLQQGKTPEAEAEYRRATECDRNYAPGHVGLGLALARQQKFPEAEKAYRRGIELAPTDSKAHLAFAGVLGKQGKFVESESAFRKAFADPSLADDLAAGFRYRAACCAALGAAGKEARTPEEKARLRGAALGWLRADLALWGKRLGDNGRAQVAAKMRQWQQDADLASVRGEKALQALPEGERQAWAEFWSDVEALRKKSSAK